MCSCSNSLHWRISNIFKCCESSFFILLVREWNLAAFMSTTLTSVLVLYHAIAMRFCKVWVILIRLHSCTGVDRIPLAELFTGHHQLVRVDSKVLLCDSWLSCTEAAATLTTESVLSEQTNSASNTPPSSSPKKGVPIGAIAGGAAGGVAVLILAGGLFVFLQRRRTAQQPKEAYPPIYNSEGHNQEHRDSQIHELPVDAHGQVSKAFDVYKSSDEPINELQGSEPPARTRWRILCTVTSTWCV